MNFNDFKEKATNEIFDFLSAHNITSDKYDVELTRSHKNNQELYGLKIFPKDNRNEMIPVFYLENIYQELENGADYEDLMTQFADFIAEHLNESPLFDADKLKDFVNDINIVKPHIYSIICNTEKNKDALAERPHKDFDDLSVYYRVMLKKGEDGTFSFAITNDNLKMWNISVDELHEIAAENNYPNYEYKTMADTIAEIMGVPPQLLPPQYITPEMDKQFVLSTKEKVNGAVAITDERIMTEIKNKIGDFYIIPSSTHEVIIMPKEALTIEFANSMIEDVNRTSLSAEDFLSDHLYEYNFKTHTLETPYPDKDLEEDLD